MVEEAQEETPGLRDYWRTLWRGRWLIALTVLIAVGLAVGISALQATVYEASASVIIQPSGGQQILGQTNQDAQSAARNVDTQVAVLKSRAILDSAKKKLGHRPAVAVASSPTSDVLSISAQSSSARRAAADANAYADIYIAYRHQQAVNDVLQAGTQIQSNIDALDARSSSLTPGSPEQATADQQRALLQEQLNQLQVSANLNQLGGTRVLAKADVPTAPIAPQTRRNIGIAFVLGLLLGIGLAFLRDYLDDSVTSREELERVTRGLPVLGEIPRIGGWRKKPGPYIVTIDAPSSPASEAYRTLRTSVQFLGVDRPLRTIQVTSVNENDGKTEIIANLAVVFARADVRVTIVCCDLRRPRIHEYFGLANDVGLTSMLLGQVTLQDALRQIPDEPNITVLAAGPPAPNPSELLASGRTRSIVASLEKAADVILIDSPPTLTVSDALIVSGMVDATVLVTNAKASSRRGIRRAVEMLRSVDAALVGTVLNMASGDSADSYGSSAHSVSVSGARRSTRRSHKEAESMDISAARVRHP